MLHHLAHCPGMHWRIWGYKPAMMAQNICASQVVFCMMLSPLHCLLVSESSMHGSQNYNWIWSEMELIVTCKRMPRNTRKFYMQTKNQVQTEKIQWQCRCTSQLLDGHLQSGVAVKVTQLCSHYTWKCSKENISSISSVPLNDTTSPGCLIN